MLDARLRRLIDPPLGRAGAALARRGVPADAVTLAGFAVGAASFPALAAEAYGWALALILLNRAMDGLDGAVARHAGATDFGGYLDIVCDFLFYSGVVFFFAVGRPEDALAAAFLVFSFVGTGSSFLAYAILAAKRGITTEIRGAKSLYYVGGITEGTETIALFAAMCLFPGAFPWLAWGFGALCWLTTAARVAAAARAFRP
ncbi:CDP-alcohol phosphatidyltransferase family protein [Skermanella sp. TT6]|uniref:CDP-alcohol phosphatidyltransferase family protein n=1 Tax=Skermanella cutis TaxID=2775420 RepID=A0ABX7B5X2_9PROT|nr:CDP-alcohol phosphatidyltransferase family protein [Skermanella sp. TT6]QQP88788.1 CDP-alcohol phosphatidyltransferase family protein [Skermanella sp. TT6]